MDINDFNSVDKIVPSAEWRVAIGSPSDESWSLYRKAIGIDDKRRFFTCYQCVMIMIRKNWRDVCRLAEVPYEKSPPLGRMVKVANIVLNKYGDEFIVSNVNALAAGGKVDATQLKMLVEILSGKSISEALLRRRCKQSGVPNYSRKAMYNMREVQTIAAII